MVVLCPSTVPRLVAWEAPLAFFGKIRIEVGRITDRSSVVASGVNTPK